MKKILALVLAVMTLAVASLPALAASWPSVSTSKKIQFIATGTIPCYRDTSLKTRGTASPASSYTAYVDPGDECNVLKVGDSVLLIDYPTSSGRKQAYVSRSVVFPSLPSAFTAKEQVKTYKTPNGAQYGSIYVNDACYNCGQSNGKYAIIYNVSGGWKLGWVTSADYAAITGGTGGQGSSGTQTKYLNGIPYYMQTDSRWSNVKIGSKTIGQVGCLVTSMAMSESYRTGSATTPAQMRNKLSFDNNDMYWPSNYFTLCSGTSQDSLNKLYNTLSSGRPVIIGAQKSGGGWHWVLCYGYKNANPNSLNTSCFMINDPMSTSRTALADFLKVYPNSVTMKTYK